MNKYKVVNLIGEGAYGVVLKCTNIETKESVAIKKFKDCDDPVIEANTLRELKMLKHLKHPNIVTLIEAFRRKNKLILVFEYVQCNLLELIDQHPHGLAQRDMLRLSFQMFLGLHWCHVHNVVHRDIKPENLLVSSNHTLKLCDFGFARKTAFNGDGHTSYIATRWYRPPELLIGLPYGYPVDIWAAACIMAELADGQPLFPGDSDIDQLMQIQMVLGPLPHPLRKAMHKKRHLKRIKPVKALNPAMTLEGRFSRVLSVDVIRFLGLLLQMEACNRIDSHFCKESPIFDEFRYLEPEQQHHYENPVEAVSLKKLTDSQSMQAPHHPSQHPHKHKHGTPSRDTAGRPAGAASPTVQPPRAHGYSMRHQKQLQHQQQRRESSGDGARKRKGSKSKSKKSRHHHSEHQEQQQQQSQQLQHPPSTAPSVPKLEVPRLVPVLTPTSSFTNAPPAIMTTTASSSSSLSSSMHAQTTGPGRIIAPHPIVPQHSSHPTSTAAAAPSGSGQGDGGGSSHSRPVARLVKPIPPPQPLKKRLSLPGRLKSPDDSTNGTQQHSQHSPQSMTNATTPSHLAAATQPRHGFSVTAPAQGYQHMTPPPPPMRAFQSHGPQPTPPAASAYSHGRGSTTQQPSSSSSGTTDRPRYEFQTPDSRRVSTVSDGRSSPLHAPPGPGPTLGWQQTLQPAQTHQRRATPETQRRYHSPSHSQPRQHSGYRRRTSAGTPRSPVPHHVDNSSAGLPDIKYKPTSATGYRGHYRPQTSPAIDS
eukprot:m.223859 g.223859  ORF g.223859 m.223859 type:complete len:758 (+) comp15143_c0_seq1:407-2680(+)